MFKTLFPNLKLDSIFDVTPELLRKNKITLLMLDLDNTLAPYRGTKPSDRLKKWRDDIISSGVDLIIVSNTKSARAKNFSTALNIPYVDHARKPFVNTVNSIMARYVRTPEESALAGDQIFTDVWCANRAGMLSIVVKPLELKNVFYFLRYAFEFIFRHFAPGNI